MKPTCGALALYVASLAVFSAPLMAATPSAANADGAPQILTQVSTPLSIQNLSLHGWTFGTLRGGAIGIESTASPLLAGVSENALEGSYPVAGAGGQFILANYGVASLKTEDIYIEFWAKMPGAKGGCKFVKIFGDRSDGYADVTIPTNYTGGDYGSIDQIVFGDGGPLVNDSQHTINLNGQNPQSIGRSYGTAQVSTPQMAAFTSADWGTAWHHFRIHVKFNSGTTAQNEVPDGEYYLEIDGKVYVDATGLYNRNPANGPIKTVEFFGWAQQDPQAFQLWYDNITISTGGFSSQVLPDPPVNIGTSISGN